jgi:hypothetical protein
MRLDRDNVATWFGEVTAGPPPPDLLVNPEAADLLERTLPDLRATPSLGEQDPGCYLFFLTGEALKERGELDLGAIALQIGRTAASSHRRLAVQWEPATQRFGPRSTAGLEPEDPFGSYIVLADERQIPTIGPGGQVLLEQRAGTIVGSASVRPFVESTQARSWVSFQAIDDELAPFLDRGLECAAEFGYYEASWMERQAVIQPTFAFLIENDPSAEYPQKWMVTVPATTGTEEGNPTRQG